MHLAEMIQSAKNHPVQVTNRKRTIAVLISPEDYEVLKQLRVHKQLSV
jgi:PHD/YefM family antitoxin component YafN of YafNO toxin-antitoxin module